ncbi:hypothetical protein HK102_002077, partial [Quaeritorhiza haematococci]
MRPKTAPPEPPDLPHTDLVGRNEDNTSFHPRGGSPTAGIDSQGQEGIGGNGGVTVRADAADSKKDIQMKFTASTRGVGSEASGDGVGTVEAIGGGGGSVGDGGDGNVVNGIGGDHGENGTVLSLANTDVSDTCTEGTPLLSSFLTYGSAPSPTTAYTIHSSKWSWSQEMDVDEDLFITITGFHRSTARTLFYRTLCIITMGFLYLFCRWFPRLELWFTCTKCQLGMATRVLIVNHWEEEQIEDVIREEFDGTLADVFPGVGAKVPVGGSSVGGTVGKAIPGAPAAGVAGREEGSRTAGRDCEYLFRPYNMPLLSLQYFEYRYHKFMFNPLTGCFVLNSYWTDPTWTSAAKVLEGVDGAHVVRRRRMVFGSNMVDVKEKSTFRLLMDEVLHPFYVFQIASIILWSIDDYYYYASCIFLISTMSAVSTLVETKQIMRKLREMSRFGCDVRCWRGGSWWTIRSEDLVPGDVFEIPAGGGSGGGDGGDGSVVPMQLFPCDAVLLQGDCIVNESMLTGESIPVSKVPISDEELRMMDFEVEDPSKSARMSRFFLFSGTKIIRVRGGRTGGSARPSRDDRGKSRPPLSTSAFSTQTETIHPSYGALGMVVRIGFNTTKGNLVRSMLFPRPNKFKFYRDSFRFIGVLCMIAILGFFSSLYNFLALGVEWTTITLRALDLITIVVPPALPATMAIGTSFAIGRLRRWKIFCISPPRVNICGKVDIMCFDKTGTLTQEGLDVLGFRFTVPRRTVQVDFDEENGDSDVGAEPATGAPDGAGAKAVDGTTKPHRPARPVMRFSELYRSVSDVIVGPPRPVGIPRRHNDEHHRHPHPNSEYGSSNSPSPPSRRGSSTSSSFHNYHHPASLRDRHRTMSGSSIRLAMAPHHPSCEQDFPYPMIVCAMATCHSLKVVNGELIGDPMDLKMFEFTGWHIEEGGSVVGEGNGSTANIPDETGAQQRHSPAAAARKKRTVGQSGIGMVVRPPGDMDIGVILAAQGVGVSLTHTQTPSHAHPPRRHSIFSNEATPLHAAPSSSMGSFSSTWSAFGHPPAPSAAPAGHAPHPINTNTSCTENSNKIFTELGVIRSFEFVSRLRRMSVIVSRLRYSVDSVPTFAPGLGVGVGEAGSGSAGGYGAFPAHTRPPQQQSPVDESPVGDGSKGHHNYRNGTGSGTWGSWAFGPGGGSGHWGPGGGATSHGREFEVFVKGAPEVMEAICLPESLPPEYRTLLKDYTHHGYRVIACAWKRLENVSFHRVMRASREEIEKDLEFLGFIVFENKLKPRTGPVVEMLREARIREVMCTGDNILTAISVSRECGLVNPSGWVFVPRFENGCPPKDGSGEENARIVWEDVDGAPVGLDPVTLKPTHLRQREPNATSGPSSEQGKASTGENGILLPLPASNPSSSPSSASVSSMSDSSNHVMIEEPLPELPGVDEYDLAVTGDVFQWLLDYAPVEVFQKVLVKGQIFARMSPDQKHILVEKLQELGYCVGFCGDGANDCGALKAADVGLSLSEAEASVAAPFTSQTTELDCVPQLIREGRAALVTSFSCFKYMALYSLIQFTSVSLLYSLAGNLGDFQYLYIDLALIIPVAMSMGRSGAYKGRLHPKRPTASLVSKKVLTSLIAQIAIQVAFQIGIFFWIRGQEWYEPPETSEDDKEYECFENTAVFLLSCYQYIIVAIVFSVGPPYRESMWKN